MHLPLRTPFKATALSLSLALAASLVLAPSSSAAPASPEPSDGAPSSSAPSRGAAPEPAPVAKAEDRGRAADAATAIREALADGEVPAAKRSALAEEALDALGMEALPAQLAQGERRIAETGSAQIPTLEELEGLARSGEAGAWPAPAPEPQQDPTSPTLMHESNFTHWKPPGIAGVDVASHQGTVNWDYAWYKGARFAYVKATQSWPSSLYKNPYFGQQYTGSYNVGMFRGAYHFAMPPSSNPSYQARQFVNNGGGWSADGRTLPPLLDIEWNPYSASTYPQGEGSACWGMTPVQLSDWIYSFGVQVKRMTGRLPMIYTARSWWDTCLRRSARFADWPLHVARYPGSYTSTPGDLPGGWTKYRVWQYSPNTGYIHPSEPVDGNVFRGGWSGLRSFATYPWA